MTMRLDHCCLNVRDMDAAIRFYQDHFDMKLLSRKELPESNAEITFLGYEADGMKLELTHWRDWDDGAYEEGTQFDHIAVVMDEDLGAFVDGLREAGVEIAKEPFTLSTGSRIAFVHDLDGNWVELIERKSP